MRELMKMRSWIRYVLGDKPDMRTIYEMCDFGPGASIGVHGQATNVARKFLAQRWTVTPLALPYALTAMAYDPLVYELFTQNGSFCQWDVDLLREEMVRKVQLVHNNKVIFVPKTTLVDRPIAVEPLLNGYIQKGIDLAMRSRLLRVGIDLSDQSLNQDLARQGSIPGQEDPFATIDLSSASDSVSSELVKFLLPEDWFELLNHCRSGVCELDGRQFLYEKFASMGNGFCFPLETLIFASVCSVYAENGEFSVYGDDIIVRQSCASQVLKLLRYIGFRENPDKTFLFGPFRESCGADWYEGQNIRPLTLDFRLDSTEAIIKFHNLSLEEPLWATFFEGVREYLFSVIPHSLRLCRPFKGDVSTAFEVSQDTFMCSSFAKWCRNTQAWQWLEYVRMSVSDDGLCEHGQWNTALMMAALRGSSSDTPFSYRRKTKRSVRRVSYAGTISLWLPSL